jgi:hypothetical protein
MVSVNPNMAEVLYHNLYRFLSRETKILMEEGGHATATVLETLPSGMPAHAPHALRAKVLQAHRQRVVNLFLPKFCCGERDYVIFVDADIVNGTHGVLNSLVSECACHPAGSVVAPAVILEKRDETSSKYRWYDTAGFIHDEQRAAILPPWFPTSAYNTMKPLGGGWDWPAGTAIELNGSVGCVYCVHAPVFLHGGFQGEFHPSFTEHWALCQNGRAMGGRIIVRLDLRVEHAYLPKYGEAFH